jgi:hypothetical protein
MTTASRAASCAHRAVSGRGGWERARPQPEQWAEAPPTSREILQDLTRRGRPWTWSRPVHGCTSPAAWAASAWARPRLQDAIRCAPSPAISRGAPDRGRRGLALLTGVRDRVRAHWDHHRPA